MNRSLRLLLICGTALASSVVADFALTQPLPPAPAATPPTAPIFDLQQLPETRGTVRRFTLAPAGELDGFLLVDGTQVHLPPHLSAQLAAAVRPGDTVSVRGYRSAAAPLVVAVAVSDVSTNQTVVDRGPPAPGAVTPPPPPGVPASGAQQTTLTGKVQSPLYSPAGDLNGAILENGVIVRLPPPTAYQSASLLVPGQVVTVQGWFLNTAYGQVVEAQAINPASTVGSPPGAAAPEAQSPSR
jgi:hypothetical protein